MPPRLATRPPAAQPAPAALPAAPPSRPLAQSLADAVSARVGAGRFNLWFLGHAQFVPLGESVVVAARNRHTRDWLESTFGAAVNGAVVRSAGSVSVSRCRECAAAATQLATTTCEVGDMTLPIRRSLSPQAEVEAATDALVLVASGAQEQPRSLLTRSK